MIKRNMNKRSISTRRCSKAVTGLGANFLERAKVKFAEHERFLSYAIGSGDMLYSMVNDDFPY